MGYVRFDAHRLILLVRNPFDAIESYFHMAMTNTHDKSLTDQVMETLQDIWDAFVLNESKVWKLFHEHWIQKIRESGLPFLIIKFEDLVKDSEFQTNNINTFMFEGFSPMGLRRTVNDWVSSSSSSSIDTGYKPRKGGIGKSLRRYSGQQLQHMISIFGDCLAMFGYQIMPGQGAGGSEPVSLESVPIDNCQFRSQIEPTKGYKDERRDGPSTSVSVLVNAGSRGVRTADDQFGRNISNIRRRFTEDDQKPFATV